ncbi:MAG TPA: aminotransferase class I/II-fold pyridoxal phosphate-dependent enzyme [Flavobacteriales bacterium]|nr:aminotransferase class I/II-fold pyridoxal phosphate-dependent enzyme [Flavobacteriales bacterium]
MPIEIESPEQMGYDNVRYNLTESSVSDQLLGDLNFDLSKTLLCYGDHSGLPALREAIAKPYNLGIKEILITQGAASALFIVASSLLEKGDHVLVMHPNYATNIETPKAIGCEVEKIELKFATKFRPDLDAIKKQIRPNTKLISITTPHNPTGMALTEEELLFFVELAESNNCYLLVDETYRELAFQKPTTLAACLSPKVISVSSLSKSYGLPGIRIGWIITINKQLQELFLAAKEQIFVTNSVLDETVASLFLEKSESLLAGIQKKNKKHFELVKAFIEKEKRLNWVEPQGGVVCFPRIEPMISLELFYQTLNHMYYTYVGPGHWFDVNKEFFRIGYGWPTTDDLKVGLQNIKAALDACG